MTDATLPAAELEALAARALTAHGVPDADAADCARVLVLADLFGIRTHGVQRVPEYLRRVGLGGIVAAAPITVERPAPGLLRVDGANGLGPVVGMCALRAAMDAARETGIAAAFVRGSNHFGPIMPYGFTAAEAGFASIIASNATTTIAPTGGAATRLGNNPLGIGVPNPGGAPVLLDIAMSVAARAKIRNALKAGDRLPEGWATDAAGLPTTDPAAALAGFLLPVGGHKGYGLALLVDLLAGVLSGAAYLTHVRSWVDAPEAAQDLGHVFILLDTARLGGAAWLHGRVEDFARIIHATPAADPARPVLLPGERELAARERGLREGVAVAAADLAEVRRLAGKA